MNQWRKRVRLVELERERQDSSGGSQVLWVFKRNSEVFHIFVCLYSFDFLVWDGACGNWWWSVFTK